VSGTGIILNRMRVGQLLLLAELEWDSLCCGQSESATGIIVDRMRLGQLLLWTE